MTIDDNIKDEKLQYDINREPAKISALSPGKTDKYEYLTVEEIFLSDNSRMMEQVKFKQKLRISMSLEKAAKLL